MEDLIITSKRLKKEIYILSACFAASFLTNIVSIIIFRTPWYEMFTQIGYVVVITLFLYFLFAIIRMVVSLIRRVVVK